MSLKASSAAPYVVCCPPPSTPGRPCAHHRPGRACLPAPSAPRRLDIATNAEALAKVCGKIHPGCFIPSRAVEPSGQVKRLIRLDFSPNTTSTSTGTRFFFIRFLRLARSSLAGIQSHLSRAHSYGVDCKRSLLWRSICTRAITFRSLRVSRFFAARAAGARARAYPEAQGDASTTLAYRCSADCQAYCDVVPIC
jgi:hypothetical protein